MPSPSDYQPTIKDPIPFYGPTDIKEHENAVLFGASWGLSYIGPNLALPYIFRQGSVMHFWGLTAFPQIERTAALLKKIPPGLRGGRPLPTESGYLVEHFDDRLVDTSITSNREFIGFTLTTKNDEVRGNLRVITATGYNSNPWPVAGITTIQPFFKSFFEELSKAGATIDCLSTDFEGAYFGSNLSDSLLNSFLGNCAYYEPFYGVSSWYDALLYYGFTAGQVQRTGSQPYLSQDAAWAWYKVATMYNAEQYNISTFDPLIETYPKAVAANYDWYDGEKERLDEAVEQNGLFWPQGGIAGNAGSPVLYGRLRHLTIDGSAGGCIHETDPTYIINSLTERRSLALSGPVLVNSASTSFMQTMMELKTAKRNSKTGILVPYINSIYTPGYGSEGQYQRDYFEIDVASDGGIQSPAEILHNKWHGVNVVGRAVRTNINLWASGGITSYDGTTSAYLIKTNIPLIANAWYKQNIKSITFDGSTTAYQINTVGLTGLTSALAYYFNGSLTAGDTYVYSYFIDVDRGFTGLNARFTLWTTTESIVSAPSLTTTTGLTFQQILPVTGGLVYLNSPISYDVGNSGWTKVAWEFRAPSASPRLGLHVYSASNNILGGYTAYVKDFFLNHKLNGTTVSINNDLSVKNRRMSVEYYYNGITPGLTYNFSYYIDVSRSYTGSNSIQTLNHFQKPIYNFPIGITYNQKLPVVRDSLFHTAGMCYGSGITWTKLEYSFNIPTGDTYDPVRRDTLAASVCKIALSVMDSEDIFGNCGYYIASPSIEMEGISGNTVFDVTPINYESINGWHFGPAVGWVDSVIGANRRYNVYYYKRPGNSAYFGELIRHCCLSGTAKLEFFNNSDFVNYGLTGSISDPYTGSLADVSGEKLVIYANSGLTQHVTSWLHLDSVLKDVHDHIGGFTTASADSSRVNWLSPYFYSGAPGLNGTTWWWRITSMPGYTVYCNGITLSSRGTVGTWIGTTGPTLANQNIYYTKWTAADALPEPNIVSPTKEINFAGMTNLNQLVEAGFTFSRGSTASYTDSTGKIVFVGPNQPRFDHDEVTLEPVGLLLEVAKTNLLNWSESFASTGGSQNNWIDFNIQRSIGNTAPSGLTNSIRFTATGSNAIIISSAPVGSSSFRTFSIFIRGISGTESVFYTLDGGTTWNPIQGITKYTSVSGTTFTYNKPSSVVPVEWKRFAFDPTTENHRVGIKLGNTGDSVELWGAQLEARSTIGTLNRKLATSYISTTSTTASTSTDSCYIGGSSFDSWYGQTYGSFVVEAKDVSYNNILSLEGIPTSTYIRLQPQVINTEIRIQGFGPTTLNYLSSKCITQDIIKETPYKFILTYSPRGLKYSSYHVDDNPNRALVSEGFYQKSLSWPGNTFGTPYIRQLTMVPFDQTRIKKIRYWPFVFDELTMRKMSKGGVDPSIGYFGAWDDQNYN